MENLQSLPNSVVWYWPADPGSTLRGRHTIPSFLTRISIQKKVGGQVNDLGGGMTKPEDKAEDRKKGTILSN